ncbi:MAG: hypothetical protein LBT47_09865 [Deltaproteobacteria bacterium]|jgi:hypothetical protein|nr:hypothetical protein [Deltaproteobacteria bacterium]
MAFFKDKLGSFGAGLKKSASTAKDKALDTASSVANNSSLQGLKEKATAAVTSTVDYGKDKIIETKDIIQSKIENLDKEKLTEFNFYSTKFKEYTSLGASKVTSAFKSTFEVDKTTSEIIEDLRKRLPIPASGIGDIFEQCKKEAFQRAISAFFLAPIVSGLDERSAAKYSNLSESYQEFRSGNRLNDDPNFAKLSDERYEARKQFQTLEDGYNSQNQLDPYSADIEHIVPKKQFYDNFLLRIATTDDQIIEEMNSEENLIFADSSLNRSKQSTDLLEYLDKNGTPDPLDDDIIHIEINGDDVTVNRAEAEEKYERVQSKILGMKIEAMKEIGLTVVNSATKLAVQQVVGLLVVETIDIFVDEIKDMTVNGNFFTADTFAQSAIDRKNRLQTKLAERFEERQIMSRAKELGIERGIAGALSIIPQILISLIVKTPAFMLSIIRESTLSAVRCLRILFDPTIDKFAAIKVVMAGTATAVLSVYVARIISNAIIPVPILNFCNSQVTEVLTGVFVTALSLSTIYCLEKNKTKLLFAIRKN